MASLKDQMLKAGLVSKEDAKRAAHSQRVETKQVGRSEVERRAAEERAAIAKAKEAQRVADQQAAAQRNAEQLAREQQVQAQVKVSTNVEAAYKEGQVENWSGNRNYFFVARGSEIEFLLVSDDASRRLAEGKAAIVRTTDPRSPYTLLHAGAAERLHEVAPERIVTWHR